MKEETIEDLPEVHPPGEEEPEHESDVGSGGGEQGLSSKNNPLQEVEFVEVAVAEEAEPPPEDSEPSPKSFPQKLLDILSDEANSDVISWNVLGNGFLIHKKKVFAAEVLPKYFKASKFTSFTRKLNRWGFNRVPRGPETGAYFHKLFQRDKPELVLQMNSNSGNKYQSPVQGQLLPNVPGMMGPGMMGPMMPGMPMPFPYMPMPGMPHPMMMGMAAMGNMSPQQQQQQQAMWQQQMQNMMHMQHMQMMQMQQMQVQGTPQGSPGMMMQGGVADGSNNNEQKEEQEEPVAAEEPISSMPGPETPDQNQREEAV